MLWFAAGLGILILIGIVMVIRLTRKKPITGVSDGDEIPFDCEAV